MSNNYFNCVYNMLYLISGVVSMLTYNDKISTMQRHLNTTSVEPRKITNVKIDMELNQNIIKNTKKVTPLSWCFIFGN